MEKIVEPIEPDIDALTACPAVYASLHMWGQEFSPKRFAEAMDFRLLGLCFAQANEPGEVSVAGPHRGRSPNSFGGHSHGAAIIRPPADVEPGRHLVWMEEYVLAVRDKRWRRGPEAGHKTEILYLTAHFEYGQWPTLVFPHYFLHGSHYDLQLVVSSIQATGPPDAFAM